MKTWTARFSLGLVVILILLAAVIVSPAKADPPQQIGSPMTSSSEESADPDCRECHWPVYIGWEQSTHGQGLSCGQCHLGDQNNHAREGHWSQGGPQECMGCHTTGYDPETDSWEEGSIHCKACHSPITQNHPDEPMPTDRSAELCGTCHIEAHFEWRASAHGDAGVTCIDCHSQHTTSLKEETVTAQCAACHEIITDGFSHSAHNAEGVSCIDCHLAAIEGPITEGMAKRNHTFSVALETCTACHGFQLHNAKEEVTDSAKVIQVRAEPVDAMASSVNADVSAVPEPASPYGFIVAGSVTAGLALGGLALGMVMVIGPKMSRLGGRIRSKLNRGGRDE